MSAQILILGADGALGAALTEQLRERRPDLSLSPATTTERLGPGLDLVDEAALRGAGLVMLCSVDPMLLRLGQAAAQLGRPVVDLSDALSPTRRLWPVQDPEGAASLKGGEIAAVATGLASPLLGVLKALAPFGLKAAQITTLESAARWDKEGMDELSEQVRGVFSGREAEVQRFSASLAFDPIPSLAEAGDDPLAADAALEALLREGLGDPALDLRLTRVLVPSFSAEAATIELQLGSVDLEAVRDRLEGARGLRYQDAPALPALDAVGRSDALVSRLRERPDGLSLWLCADRLSRGGASLGALVAEAWAEAQG